VTRVVVTGAAGYIGGRLVRHLAEGAYRVTPVDRAKMADIEAVCDGADAVVHLAGANEVDTDRDPEGALAETLAAALQTARAAEGAGVGRVVYLSTVHVYGAPAEGTVLSEDTLAAPRHPYAVARLAAERLLPPGRTVVLRLTNAVGAPAAPDVDRWSLVANDLCRQAATSGAVRLRTHGLQWRDFVPLADACRIVVAATDPAAVPAGTYNLASGHPCTVRELAELVADSFQALTGRRPVLHAPDPPPDPPKPHFVAAGRLSDLGLRADGDLRAAIDETARFCLAHRAHLAAS